MKSPSDSPLPKPGRPGVSNLLSLAAAVGLVSAPAVAAEPKFPHTYEGDREPTTASPFWQEIKGGEGKASGTVSVAGGKLRVEVPENTRHYYAIGRSGGGAERGEGVMAYDGGAEAGTTIDFNLVVSCNDPEQAIFGVHIGREDGRSVVTFSTSGVTVDGKFFAHATTDPDTYRLAFDQDALVVYSARQGKIYEGALRPATAYPHNALFFGTLAPMDIKTPGTWELDFLRWTQDGAEFSPPR